MVSVKALFLALLIGVWMTVIVSAQANPAQEKADLARIDQVLSSLNSLINDAQNNQAKNTRIQFCFQCLRRDLNEIRQGIRQEIHGVSIEPRAVIPLQGDYRMPRKVK